MKKFRNEVWISDEDYDLLQGVGGGRKMTDEQLAAWNRTINTYYFDSLDDDYIGLKFAAGLLVYTLISMFVGFVIGYLI
jgi:hypothetical protein